MTNCLKLLNACEQTDKILSFVLSTAVESKKLIFFIMTVYRFVRGS
jgi:hypothetical protein